MEMHFKQLNDSKSPLSGGGGSSTAGFSYDGSYQPSSYYGGAGFLRGGRLSPKAANRMFLDETWDETAVTTASHFRAQSYMASYERQSGPSNLGLAWERPKNFYVAGDYAPLPQMSFYKMNESLLKKNAIPGLSFYLYFFDVFLIF